MRTQPRRPRTASIPWALLLLLSPLTASAQLSITPLGAQPASILANAFQGAGVSIFNVTYQGTSASSGTFTGGTAALGLSDGIVLSTGLAVSVVGVPADFPDTNLGTGGDADLQALNGGQAIFDATALEFDFIPSGPVLTLRYVFASEEYNSYVGGNPIDQFGLFLDGVNVALLPGGVTRVGINTVNNCSDPSFYINNAPDSSSGCPVTAPVTGRPFALDGLTVVLDASVTLSAGVSHHLKAVVGDGFDRSLDTVAFLEATSLSAPVPTATPTQTPTVTPTPPPCPPTYVGPDPPAPGQCFTYPSPASVSLRFVYVLRQAGTARIRVWNERGDVVAEISEAKPCGIQESLLDLGRFASGVYFYKVSLRYGSGDEEKLPTMKFMVLR